MWTLVFNGKIQTENPDLFLKEFQSILNNGYANFIGNIEQYQLTELQKNNGSEIKRN